MRLHYIQHVPFEGPGNILEWCNNRGHNVSHTFTFEAEPFPSINSFDWLIVMGGPMGVYDDREYPWLAEEKAFLKKAIQENKVIVGICLGAQLLADALGARIQKNITPEIGWFPVSLTPLGWESEIFKSLPATFEALHWHNDTFRIPEGAIHIASSEACPNQAFLFDDRIVGLQFHIETTADSLKDLLRHCGDQALEDGEYIQQPDVIIDAENKFEPMKDNLFKLLDSLHEVTSKYCS